MATRKTKKKTTTKKTKPRKAAAKKAVKARKTGKSARAKKAATPKRKKAAKKPARGKTTAKKAAPRKKAKAPRAAADIVTQLRTPVLFLDRDGTINIDRMGHYINTLDQTLLIPGVGRALAQARTQGFKLAVITNQAGVAKGITPREVLPLVHRKLEELIAEESGLPAFEFDDVRVCLHHPDDNCACRKPQPALLQQSMEFLNADIERSFFIGDKDTDIECAQRVGMRAILVLTGHGRATAEAYQSSPNPALAGIAEDLEAAVKLAAELRDKG